MAKKKTLQPDVGLTISLALTILLRSTQQHFSVQYFQGFFFSLSRQCSDRDEKNCRVCACVCIRICRRRFFRSPGLSVQLPLLDEVCRAMAGATILAALRLNRAAAFCENRAGFGCGVDGARMGARRSTTN